MVDVTLRKLSGRDLAERIPPPAYFVTSAVFHYLGPAFAVLLFGQVAPLGVVWLRIATAAAIFGVWRRPWRLFIGQDWSQRGLLLFFGVVLGVMNSCFYLAINRLPLGTVGAIEFLGTIVLAAYGVRTRRNALALLIAVFGVSLLTDARLSGAPLGFLLAFANCALFMLYVVLGHRLARDGGRAGIDRLGAAMLIALVVVTPFGFVNADPAFSRVSLLAAGIGVGVCSSVIPYVCDQLAMSRLPRATFALMLALLPACASLMGVVVLRQIPLPGEIVGVLLVIAGVALHQAPRETG
ncbi:MAG: EamA family transporter [Nitrolancea sp.]